jgi:23S rRNA-/tRNA-specific pseudouridylate synthase
VLVNGRAKDKNYKVKGGDAIKLKFLEKEVSSVEPENIPLNILYEDEHIVVVNKPVGMVVHPAPGSPNGTFVNALLYHLGPEAASRLLSNETSPLVVMDDADLDEDDLEIDLPETPDASKATPKSLRPGIVHRLDKGTSGT